MIHVLDQNVNHVLTQNVNHFSPKNVNHFSTQFWFHKILSFEKVKPGILDPDSGAFLARSAGTEQYKLRTSGAPLANQNRPKSENKTW